MTGSSSLRFIPEIQGLRSLALALVVVYHVWFNRVSGGVDVFLMVSAFLLTRSVLNRHERGVGYNPISFLIRRFSRLLPLAAVTVLLTIVVAFAVLPPWRWPSTIADGWASLLYFENQRLQDQLVDYYAVDPAVLSPFQHFWSLSVQGQVFVLWAVLLLVAWWIARWLKRSFRGLLALGYSLVLAGSLLWAVRGVSTAPERIYFDTEARLWEFAFGSLLAVIGAVRAPRTLRIAMTWLGLAMIVSTGWLFTAQGTFPGFAALWPLTGAGLIIIAATAEREDAAAPPSLLAHPLLVRSGSVTYALYLVHWPILVFAQVLTGAAVLDPLWATGVLLLSVALSYVLTRLVADPLARFTSKPVRVGRPALVVAASLAATALVIGAADAGGRGTVEQDAGAAALADWATLDESCTGRDDSPRVGELDLPCAETSGYAQSERRILMVGGSHVQQFMPAVLETAHANGWGVRSVLLPGCRFRTAPGEGREVACHSMWQGLHSGEFGTEADLVLTLAGESLADGGYELHDEFGEWVHATREALDADVVGIRDNPRFETNIFACGQQYGPEHASCRVELRPDWAVPLQLTPTAPVVDLTEQICPGGVCTPMSGGQIVFLDSNHLTATASAELLAAELRTQMAESVEWWR